MTNPIVRIHNTETGEIIDREMTDEEFESYQQAEAEAEAHREEEAEKAAKKAELLAKLGLTEDDAKLLLS